FAVALGEVVDLPGLASYTDQSVGDVLLRWLRHDERFLAVLEVLAPRRRDLHLIDERRLLVRVDEPELHARRVRVLVAVEEALELRVLAPLDEGRHLEVLPEGTHHLLRLRRERVDARLGQVPPMVMAVEE